MLPLSFIRNPGVLGIVNRVVSRQYLPQNVCEKAVSIKNSKRPDTEKARHYTSEAAGEEDERALHLPAMLEESIDMLRPQDHQVIVDMTFGAGGHTREILSRAPKATLFALDRDALAHSLACNLAKEYEPGKIIPLLGKFSDLPMLLSEQGVAQNEVDAVLFDVGVSSMQFDRPERGFSLSKDGPLDMRMDGDRNTGQPTAADVVNTLDKQELSLILKKYGEERLARHIAHAIVESRYTFGKITRTKQLADIVSTAFDGSHKRDKLMRHSHVATKTFQALRIFVNDELNELNNGLEAARYFLKAGGRCVALTFHSLEDRIVKRHFHGIVMESKFNMGASAHYRNSLRIHSLQDVMAMTEKKWTPISRKVATPSYAGSLENPRVRSTKLRGAIKL